MVSEILAPGENAQFLGQAAARIRLQAITQRFIDGQITERTWAKLMNAEITEASTTSFLIGYEAQSGTMINSIAQLPGFAQREAVNFVNDQLRYFNNWRNQLLERAGFDASGIPAILSARDTARAMMYGSATDGAFNKGRKMAALDEHEPTIVHWRLRPADHCEDCVTLAAESPYPIEVLPTEPGAGGTRCLSNCACYLEFESAATREFSRIVGVAV